MRGLIRLTVLLAALVLITCLAVPLQSAPPPKKELTEADIREKLLAKPYLEGKLVDIDTKGDDKTFTLKVVWQVKTPNEEGTKKFRAVAAGLRRRASDAIRNKNQQEFEKAKEEYFAAEAGCWDVDETIHDFHLKATADFKLRRLELPPKESADGKPARYTDKEKAELKGKDPNVPGYKAEFADLDEGGFVRVYIDKPKKTTGTSKPADPKDKPADPKEKPKEGETAAEDVVYPVSIIVIAPEPKADMNNPFGK